METHEADITTVGNFTIDSISLPNRPNPFVVLGGSAAYTSLVTRRLEATASVISKIGADFPEAYLWWLKQEGIDLSAVTKLENEKTTRFELKYNKDLTTRTLKLKSKAPPITPNDLPKAFHAKAIHIAPIANETPYDTIMQLKTHTGVLSLDPQGLLRTFDKAGNVKHRTQIDKRILSLITIYKSSPEELTAATGSPDMQTAIKTLHNLGVETVIITQGAKGAVLSVGGARYNIPTCESAAVVDPTGAGDVFIGAFLTEYIRQKDSLWCACVGSAAASLVVERIGPTFFGDKEEIYRRAQVIYEKGIKQ
ncbi:MAG: carbohydrate kinase family protein [Candidatus Bathyarchaeota archaeon]|nr:carbohydrate kinase family protein [Candidatus Bathyarchaeota archaeon]